MKDERRRKLLRYTKTASYSRLSDSRGAPSARPAAARRSLALFLALAAVVIFWCVGMFFALF